MARKPNQFRLIPPSGDESDSKDIASKSLMYETTLATDSWILEQSSTMESPIALITNGWGQPLQIKSMVIHCHDDDSDRPTDEIAYGWSQFVPNIIDRDNNCHLFSIVYERTTCIIQYPGYTDITLAYEEPTFFDKLGEEIRKIYLHAVMMVEVERVKDRTTAIEADFQNTDMSCLDAFAVDKLIKRFKLLQRVLDRCEGIVQETVDNSPKKNNVNVHELDDMPF